MHDRVSASIARREQGRYPMTSRSCELPVPYSLLSAIFVANPNRFMWASLHPTKCAQQRASSKWKQNHVRIGKEDAGDHEVSAGLSHRAAVAWRLLCYYRSVSRPKAV